MDGRGGDGEEGREDGGGGEEGREDGGGGGWKYRKEESRGEGEGRQLAMLTKCREPAHVSFGREMCRLFRVEI